jgi:hypothetical protein
MLALKHPPVSYASASGPLYRLAENIGFAAVVMPELELGEVEREIFLADMVEAAHDAAFEETPERFEIVGVNLAAYIFTLSVADGFVREVFLQKAITRVFVSSDQIHRLTDCLSDERIQRDRVRVLDNLTDDVALPADSADDANLAALLAPTDMRFLVPMPILVLSADERLVHFNDAHKLAEIGIMHGCPEPHAHVPRRLVRAASNLPLNLERTHAFLGIEHLPENLEPYLERVSGVLENRAADDAEAVVLARLAEPVKGPCIELVDGRVSAMRAFYDAVWPASFHQELLARFVGREGGHQFAERHHAC